MVGPKQQEPLKLHPIFLKRDLSTFEENLRQMLTAKAPEPRKEEQPTGPDLISRLPLELLGMILSWLPVDSLFRAAHVSKYFRRVLLSRERAWIWRTARREQGWGDLEMRDFDELQYAKYIAADACMVCRADEVSIERWAEHRVALCEKCDSNWRLEWEVLRSRFSHAHPQALRCVYEDGCYFVPDILEQTAMLCQIEASAIRNGGDAVASVASYIEDRRPIIEATARDAATLLDCAEDHYENDLECKQQLSHDLCAFRLHQLGYDYIDYAPIFEEQVWWCWCESFRNEYDPDHDTPELFQAMSKLDWYHAALDQGEDEDELFDRAFEAIEAEHAKCIIPTWDYWKYWHGQDKSARNDEYYENRPLRAEWDELSDTYIAFTRQRRSSRLLSAFIERCEATLTALIYRGHERGAKPLAKLDRASSELAILHNLKINSNAELEPPSSFSPDGSFEQRLEEKVHLDKIRIFLRIAEALVNDATHDELRKRRYVVVERRPSGVSWTSFGQRWDEVLAGKADDDLPRARRLVDGSATDREIISIKLDHRAFLQP